jgi:hypothetical protein
MLMQFLAHAAFELFQQVPTSLHVPPAAPWCCCTTLARALFVAKCVANNALQLVSTLISTADRGVTHRVPVTPTNATIKQVSNLLARATSRSLVLLDEFGKGTLSADGVGLLASLLQHYAAQPSPPLLLACTHFSELLDPGMRDVSCWRSMHVG